MQAGGEERSSESRTDPSARRINLTLSPPLSSLFTACQLSCPACIVPQMASFRNIPRSRSPHLTLRHVSRASCCEFECLKQKVKNSSGTNLLPILCSKRLKHYSATITTSKNPSQTTSLGSTSRVVF